MWRGAPLADIPSQLLRDQWVPHLDQLHVQALDWRVEGDLDDGRHEQLVPELRDLTARHPLREHFHAQLMLALYRCGRQAEALEAYQRARRVLVDELGIEPGPSCAPAPADPGGAPELAVQPPASDAAPAGTVPVTDPVSSPAPAPRQLPGAVAQFTGRRPS